jgi:hypothetical protein
VPVYIIGTANMYKKMYGDSLPATDSIIGVPGRMTWLQADNTLQVFAKETGGAFFPYTFEGEIPKILQTINALLRSQYSLGFNPGDVRDGKQHKLKVSVDIDGDGTCDDKEYIIQARQFYARPSLMDRNKDESRMRVDSSACCASPSSFILSRSVWPQTKLVIKANDLSPAGKSSSPASTTLVNRETKGSNHRLEWLAPTLFVD